MEEEKVKKDSNEAPACQHVYGSIIIIDDEVFLCCRICGELFQSKNKQS